MNVGFIGTGVMGSAMAEHLMEHGHALKVHTRTKEKAQELLDKGARWADSAGACAKGCDAVITIVGYPKDVEQVYWEAGGILDQAPEGCYLIDMTTSSPALAVRLDAEARRRGLKALDAPVSGGDKGARAGTLTIMVGGEAADFEACKPLFEAMGKTVAHQGPSGAGQHTKMANQIAIAGTIAGVCEAVAYAEANGLDCARVLETIGSGAAGSWQMTNNGANILQNNFNPGFFIKHFIKDLNLAIEQACAQGLELSVTELVRSLYEKLAEEGFADAGTQALYKSYR